MDTFFMEAVNEAKNGYLEGGIPIGSVLVYDGQIIGRGHNRRIQNNSAILHAEMDAIENAKRIPPEVYKNSVLYTTLSPCPMCSGAILLYGIQKVVVGENTTFKGEEELLSSHGVEIQILNDKNCYHLLQKFINANLTLWHEDIGYSENGINEKKERYLNNCRTNEKNCLVMPA